MATFKKLYGDESNISLDITPFHEGWVYITTSGYYYVDLNIGTAESPNNQRIKLNAHNAETLMGKSLDEIKQSISWNDLLDKPTIPSADGFATTDYVDDIASTKVDKVNGKGLSTNDYTTTEKNKLSGISSGAEVNQNAFSNVVVGSTTIAADSKTDSLTIAAGTGISVAGDATNDKVTISNSGVRSISAGSSNGTISVNTNGTSADVAVKGLGSAAYTASSAYDSAGTAQTKADSALSSAKSYTDTKISNLINSAPSTLDTLGEIATAMEENADVVEALEAAIGAKANASHSHSISDVSGLQTALDGKAASSHGTHVSYSTTAPVMDGTASVGSASTVARSDHKHPTDTSRASKTEFDSHTSNTTAHITSTERSNWNAAKTHADSAHAPSNAQPNQNAFSNIAVSGQTTVAADTATDTVTFAGSNVTITTDATNDKVTFSVANGSTSAKGVVQLTDSTSSTSTTTAATPKNVKAAYDLANTAKSAAATAQATADGKANASHTHTVANISDLTATAKELNYMDGVTSNVQTQLDSKAASSHNHDYLKYKSTVSTSDAIDNFLEANTFQSAVWQTSVGMGVSNGMILSGGYSNTNYGYQLAIDDDPTYYMALRQKNSDGWKAWKRIPMGDGTGASGTWDINITGSAYSSTVARNLNTVHISSSGSTYAKCYRKFATAKVTSAWQSFGGTFLLYDAEGQHVSGIFHIKARTSSTYDVGTPIIYWLSLSDKNYINNIVATKDADGEYSYYLKAHTSYNSYCVIALKYDTTVTLADGGEWVESLENIVATSYISGNVANAVTAETATTATTASKVNGVIPEWSGSIANGDTNWIAAWTSDGTKIKALDKNTLNVNYATSAATATSATKATQDGSGNTITSTYATKTELDTAKSSLQTSINGKAASSHTHTIANITNLQSTLDGKVPTSRTVNGKALSSNISLTASDVGAASSSHNHVISNVDGLQAALDGKLSTSGNAVSATTASKLGSSTLGSGTQPIYLSSGTATKCSTYAGGTAVTLNGSGKGGSTASFYAPTSAGTSGYVLKSSGSGAPTWVAPSSLTIPASSIECNGNLKTVAPTTDEGDLDGGQILLGNCNADGIHAVNGLSYVNSTGLQVPLGLNVSGNANIAGTLSVNNINLRLDNGSYSGQYPLFTIYATAHNNNNVVSEDDVAVTGATLPLATTGFHGLMSASDKQWIDSVKGGGTCVPWAESAYFDELGNNIADTYVPRYTPYKRAFSTQIIGTVNGSTFTTSGYNCLVIYKRLSPKSGVLSLNFTMPSNSESSCYGFISLNNICSALGITYAGGATTDNGHWLCPQKTNLYGYGTACKILQINSIGHYVIQLGRYYDTSGDVGAWAKSNFSGSNVQVMDVYIQEA